MIDVHIRRSLKRERETECSPTGGHVTEIPPVEEHYICFRRDYRITKPSGIKAIIHVSNIKASIIGSLTDDDDDYSGGDED